MTGFGRPSRARRSALRITAACLAAAAPAAAQSQVWKTFGSAAGAALGRDFDALDDVDRDGVVDLVVGAPGDASSFQGEGSVTLLSGRDGSAIWKFYGGMTNAALGLVVRRMSDVDGDRTRDLLTLSQDASANQSVLSARSGATGSVLWERREPSLWGYGGTLVNAGDVDGDGYDDVVARIGSDHAAVLSGRLGNEVLDLPIGRYRPSPYTIVGGGGDVDGDGVPDVIVADPYFQAGRRFTPGAAWVFSGADGHLLHEVVGVRDGAELGYAAAILGDLDGDGHAEFAVGAPRDDRLPYGQGWAEVRSGQDGSLRAWHAATFPSANTKFLGYEIENVGDVNRDGVDDYTVSAIGQVFLYSGRDDYRLYHFEDRGTTLGYEFGHRVVPIGDVDGDGRPDLAISDPQESMTTAYLREGSVSVWRTRELMTDASPRALYATWPCVVTVGQDQPTQPFGIALVEVSGTPTFALLAGGRLDPTGRGYLSGRLPYGLSGMTFKLQGMVLDASGQLITTEVETVTCL